MADIVGQAFLRFRYGIRVALASVWCVNCLLFLCLWISRNGFDEPEVAFLTWFISFQRAGIWPYSAAAALPFQHPNIKGDRIV